MIPKVSDRNEHCLRHRYTHTHTHTRFRKIQVRNNSYTSINMLNLPISFLCAGGGWVFFWGGGRGPMGMRKRRRWAVGYRSTRMLPSELANNTARSIFLPFSDAIACSLTDEDGSQRLLFVAEKFGKLQIMFFFFSKGKRFDIFIYLFNERGIFKKKIIF